MKSKITLIYFILLLLLGRGVQSHAQTVDRNPANLMTTTSPKNLTTFDGLERQDPTFGTSPFYRDNLSKTGWNFSVTIGDLTDNDNVDFDTKSDNLVFYAYGVGQGTETLESGTIIPNDNLPFIFNSIRVKFQYKIIDNTEAPLLTFEGYKDGSSVENARKTVTLSTDFTTVEFGSEFKDVDEIRWNVPNLNYTRLFFDDITINEVPKPFITTWLTTSANETIGFNTIGDQDASDNTMGIVTSFPDYDFTVDWGDGNIENYRGDDPDPKHEYATSGTHTISITGELPTFTLKDVNGFTTPEKLQTVKQWGDIVWYSTEGMFYNASNMTYNATDTPNLSLVTNMADMFFNASSFNGAIGDWNVSSVIDMSSMFGDAVSFNQPLNDWEVSNVKSMYRMFNGAINFNGNIADWDVSSVIDMQSMFADAAAFNQDIGSWDVAGVRDMIRMFAGASAFNQNINTKVIDGHLAWNISGGPFIIGMFKNATSFNQPLDKWYVSQVDDLSFLFKGATDFNQDISSWDVSNSANFNDFLIGTAFSQENYDALLQSWSYLDLVDNIRMDLDVIYSCAAADARQSIIDDNNWTINDGGSAVDCDFVPFVTTWEVTSDDLSLTIPTGGGADITEFDFTIDWGDGTAENIKGDDPDPTHTYEEAGTYTISISGTFPWMSHRFNFDNAAKLQTVEQWGNVIWENMSYMFRGAVNMTYKANDVPDLTKVDDMSAMFSYTRSFNGDISNWNVSSVTLMQRMFERAEAFNQDLNNWDVSSVSSMKRMFNNALAFNGNISDWKVSGVEDMLSMFESAEAFNQNLNNWDVSSVKSMRGMFRYASAFNGNIAGWNVSNVIDMGKMFGGALAFNQDLNNWDVSSVRIMEGMFQSAKVFNGNISDWDVSDVTDMNMMFQGASAFNQNLGDWDISKVGSLRSMFSYSGLSTTNYDALLLGWSQLELRPNLKNFYVSAKYSCAGAAARQTIIYDFGWSISDKGFNFPLSLVLDENNQANITETMLTTNCGDYAVSAIPSSFNCADLGSEKITIFITDNLGNSTVEDIIVNVQDSTAPSVETQDIRVTLDENGGATVSVDDVIASTTDNCSTEFYSFFNASSDIVSNLSQVYAFGFEDNYIGGGDIDYPSLHTYSFVPSTNTIANPNLVFTIDEFEVGYYPIAFDQDPTTGTGYFIVGDKQSLLTYNFDNQDVIDTGVNINGKSLDMTFDRFGVAYVWIRNNIRTLDLTTGVTSTLVDVSQGGDGKGLTYDYDNHRLILASKEDESSKISIGAVDLVTNTHVELTKVDAPASNLIAFGYSSFQGIEYIGNNNYLVSGGLSSYMFGVLNLETLEDGSTQHSFNVTVPNTHQMNPNQPGLKDLFVPYSIGKTDRISYEGCDAIGEYTYELETRDTSGNTALSNVTITVADETAPTVLTKDITIQLDENGKAEITAAQVDNGSTDNCGIESLVLDITDFTSADLGENTVTLTVTDASGNSTTAEATVTVEDSTLSTNEFENANVSLYPNPATSQITIEATGIKITEVSIYDLTGKIVKTSENSQINVSNLPSGVYLVRLTDDTGRMMTRKFIKD